MKRIELTRGKFALVDDCDFDALNKHKWCFATVGYAVREAKQSDGYKGRIYMHRAILNARKGEEVDHVNFNRLDNRRRNIRIAFSSQNKCHRTALRHNTSGFKGVDWKQSHKKWRARISISTGSVRLLGYFNDKYEAYAAYCTAAKEHHGEFCHV